MSPRLRTAAATAIIVASALFTFALISGFLYEHLQRVRDRERFPQVGRSIDIRRGKLNIYCSGTGSPAVIFISGATWPLYDNPKQMWEEGLPHPGYSWTRIQIAVAGTTTACWYDRAGSGWSDLGPYPRDSASHSRDLHTLLAMARVSAPYVLVAEYSAALDAQVYTHTYPNEVAGLVLVDPVDADFLANTRGEGRAAKMPAFIGRSQDAAAKLFNEVGIYRAGSRQRLSMPERPLQMSPSEWKTIWYLTHSAKARSALMQDIAAWQQSAAEARAAGDFGDRLVTIISSENHPISPRYRNAWADQQTRLTRLSSRAKQVVVTDTRADLIYDAPQTIAGAVQRILNDIRGDNAPH